jgi:nicotinate-nucleotide adenylyltransferase
MNVVLFFGSFNPLHIGHVAIAGHVLNEETVDLLWFVLSPQNPYKATELLAPFRERASAIQQTLDYYADSRLHLCEIEDSLPRPSYTFNTLEILADRYHEHSFSILVGGDSLVAMPKWYRGAEILSNYPILVYPRGAVQELSPAFSHYQNIHMIAAPLLDISSSYIRAGLAAGKNMKFFEAPKRPIHETAY